MSAKPRLLVAVLHWGLGHATRCIPLIELALIQGFEVILASDGAALQLLQQRFPSLAVLELPTYAVRYSRQGRWMLPYWLWQSKSWWHTYRLEKQRIQAYISQQPVQGILSDSRPGVYAPGIPSVYLTHQIHPQAGWASRWAQQLHRGWMQAFTAVWIPDQAEPHSLGGLLSNPPSVHKLPKLQYIGPLSQCHVAPRPRAAWQVVALLSGPEPQRSILEKKLSNLPLQGRTGLLIRGLQTAAPTTWPLPKANTWQIIDFADAADLAGLAQHQPLWIGRSGYSSLMDWQLLQQKALLIPTPGQPEQEYLARWLQQQRWLPAISQNDLNAGIWDINWSLFSGLPPIDHCADWEALFRIFRE